MITDLYRKTGFTLPEMLVSLSIVAVLGAIAAPSLGDLLAAQQATTALKEVATSLRLARSLAIMNNELVTVCAVDTHASCSRNWEAGNIVFADHNENRAVDDSEPVFREFQHTALPGTIRWRAFRNRRYLQFTPQGYTRYQNGNFTFCHHSDAHLHQQLIVSRTGRLRFTQDRDGDGLKDNSQGQPIDCS